MLSVKEHVKSSLHNTLTDEKFLELCLLFAEQDLTKTNHY